MKKVRPKIALKLPAFLRSKRLEAGLSQVSVAKDLGYKTPQFVNNWEKGRSSPPLEAVAHLIVLYKLDRDEILEIMLEDARVLMNVRLDQVRASKASHRKK